MAKDSERHTTTEVPGTNPNVGSTDGGINPSAPTAGTEGWGTTSDEKAVLSPNNQAAARAGQMKGNPAINKLRQSTVQAKKQKPRRLRGLTQIPTQPECIAL